MSDTLELIVLGLDLAFVAFCLRIVWQVTG